MPRWNGRRAPPWAQRGMQSPVLLVFLVTIPLAAVSFYVLPGILAPTVSTFVMFGLVHNGVHPRIIGFGDPKWYNWVVAVAVAGLMGILLPLQFL